jgi:cytochrome c oxidase subunit 2
VSPRNTRSRKGAFLLLLALVALVGAGCARGELPQDTLSPVGPEAVKIDHLFKPVLLVAGIVFVLVNALIIICIVRFRAKSDDDAPVQVHGNAKLEIGWTVVPAAILLVIGIFTVFAVLDINKRASGSDVLTVKVVGHQWWWEYEYPDLGITTANELHIPTGRPVQLEMTSADVIHSFWPPKLAGKLDVVPGRVNYMKLSANEPGDYSGQCAEYCGLSHANMRLRVIADAPADFDDWVANQQKPSVPPTGDATVDDAVAGSELFVARGCSGCHTVNGLAGAAGKVGPNLTHLQTRSHFAGAIFPLDEKSLRRWLRDPPGMKPMNPDNGQGMPNLGLSETDITKLIAYLETLK